MADQDTTKEARTSSADSRMTADVDGSMTPGPEFLVGWWDATLNANYWFAHPAVAPADAAMLLCCQDPSKGRGAAETVTTECTGPQDFWLLSERFGAEAKVDPTPRRLLDWFALAKANRLRYHRWIDEYLDAGSKLGPDAGNAAGCEALTHNLSAQDQTGGEAPLAAGKTYWRQVLQTHAARIDSAHGGRATALQAIDYLKRLGDRRLPPGGGAVDVLTWLTDLDDRRQAKKKTVANALRDARKRQMPPGAIPP